jgi:hypothetical protein
LQELLSDKKLQRIHTMPPQILKPKRLWTGKQIISTLLKNIVLAGKTDKEVKRINKTCGMILEGKSRLKASEWGPLGKSEGEVIIRDNELLQGPSTRVSSVKLNKAWSTHSMSATAQSKLASS